MNLFPNANFPRQGEGIVGGHYQSLGGRMAFNVGPYSEYNKWRDWFSVELIGVPAKLVFEGSYDIRPASLLVNFTDADGLIGPVSCGALADVMADWRHKISLDGTNPRHLELYDRFLSAFLFARHGGCVKFC